MKCNRILIYGWKSSRSRESNKRSVIISSIPEPIKEVAMPSYIAKYYDRQEVCNGDIKATVSIEYGGNYEHPAMFEDANIAVSYKCTKCKAIFSHKDLPETEYELSEFLTKFVQNM